MRIARYIYNMMLCENSNFNIKIAPVPLIYSEVGFGAEKEQKCV